MKPVFALQANGKDITAKIADRFVSLSYQDNAGVQNDRLTLTLDDREPYIDLPSLQTELTLFLGYAPDTMAERQYTGLHRMGVFTVDEINPYRDPARQLQIVARANDTGGPLKSVKSRSWENITVQEMVGIMAREGGMKATVHPDFALKRIDQLQQVNQSNQGVLTEWALKNNAVFKVVDNTMYIGPRGPTKSASGKKVSTITLLESELERWNVLMQTRSNYSGVTAKYYDQQSGTEKSVSVPGGGTGKTQAAYVVQEVAANEQEARQLAAAQAGQLQREGEGISFTSPGLPALRAEILVKIDGMRPGVRDTWLITTAVHNMSRSGYTTTCDGEIPTTGVT